MIKMGTVPSFGRRDSRALILSKPYNHPQSS
jgi:hypothetical protein